MRTCFWCPPRDPSLVVANVEVLSLLFVFICLRKLPQFEAAPLYLIGDRLVGCRSAVTAHEVAPGMVEVVVVVVAAALSLKLSLA